MGGGAPAPIPGDSGRIGADNGFPLGDPHADRTHGGAAHNAGNRGAEPDGGSLGISE